MTPEEAVRALTREIYRAMFPRTTVAIEESSWQDECEAVALADAACPAIGAVEQFGCVSL